jgi:hypothetical protein
MILAILDTGTPTLQGIPWMFFHLRRIASGGLPKALGPFEREKMMENHMKFSGDPEFSGKATTTYVQSVRLKSVYTNLSRFKST